MTVVHSNKIDDILTGVTPTTPEPQQEEKPEVESSEASETPQSEDPYIEKAEEAENGEGKKLEEVPNEIKKEEKLADDEVLDEYGNKTDKPKMYSEDDVQRMIRDRLARGQQMQPHQQAQVQKAAEDFKADPNSEEPWEVQLENFVEKTFDKLSHKKQTKEWQQREQQAQAEFESKFSTSMNRYKDFREVTRDLPITDAMMVATRDMKDPAAFIYAASKLHGDEVKRISQLSNPIQQGVEIGRLEEKMRKARNVSRTAPPLKQTKGDISAKETPKPRIEDRISQYAKQKRR